MSAKNLWLKPILYPDSNWQAQDRDVKVLFGLAPTAKWPDKGMPHRLIQGIRCWVEPAPARIVVKSRWSDKMVAVKSSKHRTFGICPECNKAIPLGRMQQHAKIHKE
jgi:hypothetical protein